jgi:hypothetical protein
MRDRKHIRRDETIPISISAGERDLIKKHTFIDLELEEILDRARETSKGLAIDITLDDLDELLGFIAAEANHTNDADLERALDEIYDRLAEIEERYELIDE